MQAVRRSAGSVGSAITTIGETIGRKYGEIKSLTKLAARGSKAASRRSDVALQKAADGAGSAATSAGGIVITAE